MVETHDVQYVEVLALVLVDALYLYIEQCVRIQRDARALVDVVRQALFGQALDAVPALAEAGIINVRL